MLIFIVNAVLLGAALAMDAFSVSIANALKDVRMRRPKMLLTAGVFGVFQAVMPMAGWFFVTKLEELFESLRQFIPWISLLLLLFLGIKMIVEGIRGNGDEGETGGTGFGSLILQGVATSIDALSVGFTIAGMSFWSALAESLIIGAVTFAICMVGLLAGKRIGSAVAGKGTVIGGIILIAIGAEIFIKALLDPSVPVFLIR